MAVEGTMPAAIICFEGFRSERDRRRARDQTGQSAAAESQVRDRLASVFLSARQIAHRRAMLHFGARQRRIAPAPIREAMTERE